MNYRKAEAKAAAFEQFRGVWAAIATPFTPDDKLDEAGVKYLLESKTSIYLSDPDGARVELISDPLGEMYGEKIG